MTNVYDLAAVREREGKEPSPPLLTIKFEDGTTKDIPAVEYWPDEAIEAVSRDVLNMSDMITVARTLLGDRYPDWQAAGRNAKHFFEAIKGSMEEEPGESSASTDS